MRQGYEKTTGDHDRKLTFVIDLHTQAICLLLLHKVVAAPYSPHYVLSLLPVNPGTLEHDRTVAYSAHTCVHVSDALDYKPTAHLGRLILHIYMLPQYRLYLSTLHESLESPLGLVQAVLLFN